MILKKCDFHLFSDSRRSYHRCKKGGVWQKPENVLLNCTPNGKKISYINLRFYCQNIQQFKYSAIYFKEKSERLEAIAISLANSPSTCPSICPTNCPTAETELENETSQPGIVLMLNECI